MKTFTKRQRVKLIFFVLTFFLIGTIIGFNKQLFKFKADEPETPGTTAVANLIDNRADYPDSKIPKYEKFEVTFDINRLASVGGAFKNNLNDEVNANTVNPYWPYDPNPSPNDFFSKNHPEWNADGNYYQGASHVDHNGATYACIKKTPVLWTNGTYFTAGFEVKYQDNIYVAKTGHYASDNAQTGNIPGTTNGAEEWDLRGAISDLEPGVGADWQTYWTTNFPANPIPVGIGISVEGLFTDPNNNLITQPGFYYQNFDENGIAIGSPVWKVRLAVTTDSGVWRYRLKITDASGTTYYTSPQASFEATASSNHGFVKVSSNDKRYFELSDGTTLSGGGIQASFISESNPSPTSLYNDNSIKQYIDNMASNGIKTARWFMEPSNFVSPFGNIWYSNNNYGGGGWTNLMISRSGGAKALDRYSASIGHGVFTRRLMTLQAGVHYRLTANIKTEGTMDGTGVYPYIVGYHVEHGSAIGETVDSATWVQKTLDFTPAHTAQFYIGVKNTTTSGTAYADDLSLKTTTDGGTSWSGEMMAKGDFDSENYIDLYDAWRVDKIFDEAQEQGIYLKTVITNKEDMALMGINPDGTQTSYNKWNLNTGRTGRWLQEAWWRTLIARWGANTSVHSWEIQNEGGPWDESFYAVSNDFADYIHNHSGINPHLVGTSFDSNFPTQFWKTSHTDFSDLHAYYGPIGPRIYAWSDNIGFNPPDAEGNLATWTRNISGDNGTIAETIIGKISYGSGYNSQRGIKFVTEPIYKENDSKVEHVTPMNYFNAGVDPTHKYALRLKAKSDHTCSLRTNVFYPSVKIEWQKAMGHDYVNRNYYKMDSGNYDWKTYEWSSSNNNAITPPSDAGIAGIQIAVPPCSDQTAESPGTTSTFSVDDLEFIDENTGQNLFVGGDFEDERIDYDSALAVKKYGSFFNSFANYYNKPVMWGETGLSGLSKFGNFYNPTGNSAKDLAYPFNDENQMVYDDVTAIYLKKMIWGGVGPDNTNMSYFWAGYFHENGWPYFGAYQKFIDGVQLSNGKYKDAAATTTNVNLRAWGQKDVTDGKADRAHIWIDNKPYTWKAVANNHFDTNNIKWKSSLIYASGSIASDPADSSKVYKSLQDGNTNHSFSESAWWEDRSSDWWALLDMPSSNPDLPASVSGAVTIPNMKDGLYTLAWYNTTTGDIITNDPNLPQELSTSSGNLTIPIANLPSDIALKVEFKSVTPVSAGGIRSFTYKDKYNVTGTKTDRVTKVLVNGKLATIKDNNWNIELDLSMGETEIRAVGYDKYDNASEPAVYTISRRKTADANADTFVDISDFAILMSNWTKKEDRNVSDFNEDGDVNISDFAMMMNNWNK